VPLSKHLAFIGRPDVLDFAIKSGAWMAELANARFEMERVSSHPGILFFPDFQ